MDPTVRPATLADAPELARLEAMGRINIADERGGALYLGECVQIGTEWLAVLADQSTWVYLAVIEDVPVGYLVMQHRPQRQRGVVTHVFVEEPARELGFGDAMLRTAIGQLEALGAEGIEATALPGDRETKNLFERCGLVARKITVYKSLTTASSHG